MAVLYVWSGAAGSGSGADWTNAKTTLTAAFTTEVAGDTLYVAHDHAESTAAAVTLTSSGTVSNPTKIICVNRAGSVPPVSADILATAQVTTTGNSTINFVGFAHYDGIIFTAGSGATGAAHLIIPSSGTSWLRFDNCSLRIATTLGTGVRLYIGNTGSAPGSYIEWNNTTVSFGAVGQTIDVAAVLQWRNTPSAIVGATIPTVLFSISSAPKGGTVECIGVDFSAMAAGKTIVNAVAGMTGTSYRFVDCKLNAAATLAGVPTSHGSTAPDFIRSGATGVNYAVYRTRISGLLTEEITIVRTGGATDGTTPIAWKIITTANCNYSSPFECPPIAIWNDTTGSAKTATVEGIWGGGAVPNDDDVWIEVEYLGDASSPQGSFVSDGKANLLATTAAQTSSSETWGGSTTKFKLGVTFTAQQKGWIYARVKCGKASATYYIDPLITLT